VSTARDSARVLGGGLAVAVLAALAVIALGAGGPLRHWFALQPAAPPSRGLLDVALSNLRVVSAGITAAVAIRLWPRARPLADIALTALLAVNAALVGAALAAYGSVLWAHAAAHTALELLAAALVGGAYLRTRRDQQAHVRLLAGCSPAAALVLAAAALLETQAGL